MVEARQYLHILTYRLVCKNYHLSRFLLLVKAHSDNFFQPNFTDTTRQPRTATLETLLVISLTMGMLHCGHCCDLGGKTAFWVVFAQLSDLPVNFFQRKRISILIHTIATTPEIFRVTREEKYFGQFTTAHCTPQQKASEIPSHKWHSTALSIGQIWPNQATQRLTIS